MGKILLPCMHEYSIPLAQNFYIIQLFLAYFAAATPLACQCSVWKQEVWSFRPLTLMLCRPISLPGSTLFCTRVVWTCILYSSGFLPWLSSCTHQHRLLEGHPWPESCGNLGVFIIQRPCSLCCFRKGQAKVCVLVERDARLTQCHWRL